MPANQVITLMMWKALSQRYIVCGSSAGGSILGEENNEEAGSNAHWDKKDQNDDWVVPVNVVIEDQEEVHGNHVDGKENSEDTNSNNTALNWEATAAFRVLGVFIAARAQAAAAWGKSILKISSDRNLISSWRSFFHLFGLHHISSNFTQEVLDDITDELL